VSGRPEPPRIGARRPVRNPSGRRPAAVATLGASRRRLRAGLVVALALLLVLTGRLVQLQGLDSTAYAAKAQAQRMRTTVLPATRGAITDRNGNALARDAEARLVFGDPTLVGDADAAAAALAPLLGRPQEELAALLRRPGTAYVPLAHLVGIPTGRRIVALRLPGIGVMRESRRDHPGGDLAAALVGVLGQDGVARSGVEAWQDPVLRGRDGVLKEEIDLGGRAIPAGEHSETPAVDGAGIRLTIDRDLQWAAQQALQAQVTASGARGGQVVVLDPRTGEVLALASAPGFRLDAPIAAGTRLGLPAVADSYEPGSVNKVVTASAALEAGLADPLTPYTVPPSPPGLAVPGRPSPVRDAEPHGVERLTLTGVLAQSSNIGTVLLAEQLGRERLYAALRAFGLGSLTGVGFPGETPGLLPKVAAWNASQAATIPFGQGVAATGLQIASVYAAIAGGGMRATPRLLSATVAPDGTTTPVPSAPPRRVVSAATAAAVTGMLEAVTTGAGTGEKAVIPGYRIAGKTGTAQAVGANGLYEPGAFVASFVGFAPADAPRLVVSVVLDHPSRGSHFGGDIAAPVFRQVMGFALRALRIPPTGSPRPTPQLCWGSRPGGGGCPAQ